MYYIIIITMDVNIICENTKNGSKMKYYIVQKLHVHRLHT